MKAPEQQVLPVRFVILLSGMPLLNRTEKKKEIKDFILK